MQTVHLLRKLDPAQWGGTESAMQRLFEGLRQQDVSATVYCPRLQVQAQQDPLTEAGCTVRRFRTCVPVLGLTPERRRQMVSVGGNLMSFDLPSLLGREKKAAVIHSHVLGRIGGIGLRAARRLRRPFVVSIHGGLLDLPQTVRQQFATGARHGWEWGKLFGWIYRARHLLEDADAVLACNETEAALLRKEYPRQRVFVQSHGVPLPMYRRNQREAALNAYPEIRHRRLLLCAGRIDPVKNQEWLVEQAPVIFQRHPDTVLVLAGPCTDDLYGQRIRRKIQDLGMQARISLTGGLPADDPRLIGLLQQAAAVILPSLSETFGLVALEAWAAGANVLSRTSGPSALVKHGINGWIFDLDRPHDFHRALEVTLSNSALAAQMAARGSSLCEQFSVAASAGRLKKIYEDLIEAKQCDT